VSTCTGEVWTKKETVDGVHGRDVDRGRDWGWCPSWCRVVFSRSIFELGGKIPQRARTGCGQRKRLWIECTAGVY
jgi:hypothetical protein